ncbi:CBS domain-containing protein [Jeotgalibaca dankookensis]|uniref:CBS domain-containing protein n=1 Tax=Jeotgalibaca dankookensis TaxID=708126 RepID=UPI0007812FC3|nr:CBS domain-containing protein [Jeotgalibaca dankookensis]
MNNSNLFIKEFNSLHNAMQEAAGKDGEFYSLLHELKNTHPVVKKYESHIDLARRLRNLLVHESKADSYAIAQPSPEIIQELKLVRMKLENPEKVSLFKKEVITLDVTDSLTKVLDLVEKHNITQFPVFNNKHFEGMLSDNGITHWLARVLGDKVIQLTDVRVKDIIQKDEELASYIIVSSNMPLYEVEQQMMAKINRTGNSKVVVLITPAGNISKKADIIGIITPWDMPEIISKL